MPKRNIMSKMGFTICLVHGWDIMLSVWEFECWWDLSGQGKCILLGGTRGKMSASVANIMGVATFTASKLFEVGSKNSSGKMKLYG